MFLALNSHFRLNWSGNGPLYIGKGVSTRNYDPNKQLEAFDLAAVFFQKIYKTQPKAKTTSNKLGFWYIRIPNQQFWIGIPAWFPAILLLVLLLVFRYWNKNKNLSLK